MERRPTAATGQRAYDNFVPSHEVISGQRPVADNRWTRFLKELQVPDYCNVSEIKAKFEDGLLYIIKPILVAKPSTDEEAGKDPETSATSTRSDRKATTEKKKADDGSKNGVSRKTKPKRQESDGGGVNKQSNEKKEPLDAGKDVHKVREKERDGIEGPKYRAKHEEGRNGTGMSESRKVMTPELTSPERGNALRNPTIVRGGGGFHRRKHLMLNAAIAIVMLVVGVGLYVTRSMNR
ncbi:hypothetical protein B296_00029862 [Ensete ventricosum]|uniref:SHSP domain-containing protein n=1 Tax=Ensete ventricosum TaxID=4639 RepID=A0A426ZC95_ENSVE|nr:hypothetical protein B296_00029862 [Ensete ventricosum]